MPVQVSEKGKYIRFSVDVWYQPDEHAIHVASSDSNIPLHTTINNNPESKRCHESFYRSLEKLLREYGKWPEGE